MAGLRDYQQYLPSHGDESPFWERTGHQSSSSLTSAQGHRRRRHRVRATADENKPPSSTSEHAHQPQRSPCATSLPSPSVGDEEAINQYLTLSCNVWGMLTDHVLVHPLLVLRRQCQINGRARSFHTTPFSLPLVVYALQRRQGASSLYKGLGSALLVRSATMAVEDVLSKVADCRRLQGSDSVVADGGSVCSPRALYRLGQQTLLRAAAALLVWPLAAASFSETVQSSMVSGGGGGGPLEVLADGGRRAACWLLSSRAARYTRQLPAWRVAPLAAVHAASLHVLATLTAGAIYWLLRRLDKVESERRHDNHRHHHRRHRHHHQQPQQQEHLDSCWHQLAASAGGRYVAELLLYPCETVVARLQTQGTRALVDSLDTSATVAATSSGLGACGKVVVAISSRYDSVVDCWNCVLREEGVAGLYRGVGALITQACVHMALLYTGRVAVSHVRAWLCANRSGGVRLGGDGGVDDSVSMTSVAASAMPVKETVAVWDDIGATQTITSSLVCQPSSPSKDDDGDDAIPHVDDNCDDTKSSAIVCDDNDCIDDADDDIPAMTVEEWRRIYGRVSK